MSDEPAFNCRQITELVTEYLEGGPDPVQRLAFERHVAICPPCRGYLSQLRRLARAGEGLTEEQVPEPLRAGLVRAFRDWNRERGRS